MPRVSQRPACASESKDCSSDTASGTGRSDNFWNRPPFQATNIQAPSPPKERCLPGRALIGRAGEGTFLYPGSLGDQSAQVSSLTVEATHLLEQALFWAFILSQEAGLNARPLCTFPARVKLPCREYSDH